MQVSITTDVKRGRAARMTTFNNGWTIETRWDKYAHAWITQIRDAEGYCRDKDTLNAWLSEPSYTPHFKIARIAHTNAIEQVLLN